MKALVSDQISNMSTDAVADEFHVQLEWQLHLLWAVNFDSLPLSNAKELPATKHRKIVKVAPPKDLSFAKFHHFGR